MGHESHHRPEHGHGHHDEMEVLRHLHQHALEVKRDLQELKETLAILRDSAGRTEQSVGAVQGGVERILETMAVNTQVKDALDALEVKIAGRVTTEMQQVKDAILAAVGTAAATIDELNAKVAQLVAESDPSETVSSISELGNRLDTEIDAIGPNPPVVEPPPPPVEARRR